MPHRDDARYLRHLFPRGDDGKELAEAELRLIG